MTTDPREGDIPAGEAVVETGTNPPRGVTLAVNGPWAAEQGPDGERRYAQAIADVVGRGATEDLAELEGRIRDQFLTHGLSVTDHSVALLAEQLLRAEPHHVSVVGSDGHVLYGDADAGPATHEPGVHGLEDPAHPDRPLLS